MTGEVAVLGAGMHPWGKWGRGFVEYGTAAARAALADAGLEWRDVGSIVGADTVRGGYPGYVAGATFAKALGWQGARVASVYAACASGAQAVNTARAQILSGLADVVLVVGADAAPKGFFRPAGGDRPDDPDWLRFRVLGRDQSHVLRAVRAPADGRARGHPGGLRTGQGEERRRWGRSIRTRATASGSPPRRSPPPPWSPIRCGCSTSARPRTAGPRWCCPAWSSRAGTGRRSPVRIRAVSTVTPRYPNTVLDLPDIATDSAAAVEPAAETVPGVDRAGGLRGGGRRARGPLPRRGVRPVHRPGVAVVRGPGAVRGGRGRRSCCGRARRPWAGAYR